MKGKYGSLESKEYEKSDSIVTNPANNKSSHLAANAGGNIIHVSMLLNKKEKNLTGSVDHVNLNDSIQGVEDKKNSLSKFFTRQQTLLAPSS